MTWTVEGSPPAGGSMTLRFARAGEPLSRGGFLDALAADPAFRQVLGDALRAAPFEAFCWETPPCAEGRLDLPFSCAVVTSPALAGYPSDSAPFGAHFHDRAPIATFESLGRDALLVAPSPQGDRACYAHLAAFLRGGPPAQIDAWWAALGVAARSRLAGAPIWVSTAGLGVAWLHGRVDSRPKYYRTRAYTSPDR
jgi:hypothetical protein